MGEIADMMLDGELCEACGEYLDGEAPGYPRKCDGCAAEHRAEIESPKKLKKGGRK